MSKLFSEESEAFRLRVVENLKKLCSKYTKENAPHPNSNAFKEWKEAIEERKGFYFNQWGKWEAQFEKIEQMEEELKEKKLHFKKGFVGNDYAFAMYSKNVRGYWNEQEQLKCHHRNNAHLFHPFGFCGWKRDHLITSRQVIKDNVGKVPHESCIE